MGSVTVARDAFLMALTSPEAPLRLAEASPGSLAIVESFVALAGLGCVRTDPVGF